MINQKHYLQLASIDELKHVNLIKAVRLIAFNEKPISDEMSVLFYPSYDGSMPHMFFVGEEKKKMEQAKNIILGLLIQGKLKAYGYEYVNTEDDDSYLLSSEKRICILPEDWRSAHLEYLDRKNVSRDVMSYVPETVLWLESKLEVYKKVSGNNICSVIYDKIQITTRDIKMLLSNQSKTNEESPEVRGRKAKFDWHNKIYPEIVVYVHENGNVDNASKMAEDIYSICSKKYGEENTPDIETIRKLATTPITRRFKFGNN